VSAPFRETALSVLSDLASEFMMRAGRTGQTELSDDDQQRLFNVTAACVELGASTADIAAALRGGFAEGGGRP
jgi:hypothetical protein